MEYEYKNKFLTGKASYIERNYAMIDLSSYCLFYYNENNNQKTNSGTERAYIYAKRKGKKIINVFKN